MGTWIDARQLHPPRILLRSRHPPPPPPLRPAYHRSHPIFTILQTRITRLSWDTCHPPFPLVPLTRPILFLLCLLHPPPCSLVPFLPFSSSLVLRIHRVPFRFSPVVLFVRATPSPRCGDDGTGFSGRTNTRIRMLSRSGSPLQNRNSCSSVDDCPRAGRAKRKRRTSSSRRNRSGLIGRDVADVFTATRAELSLLLRRRWPDASCCHGKHWTLMFRR